MASVLSQQRCEAKYTVHPIHQVCLQTEHTTLPSTYVSTYVHLRTYIQGILPTYYSTIPCHTPHTLPPHTDNPHPPSSHTHFSPFLLTPTTHTLLPHTHISPSLLTHTVHPSLLTCTPRPGGTYRRPVGFIAISSRQIVLSVKETASHTMPSRMYSILQTHKQTHTYVRTAFT